MQSAWVLRFSIAVFGGLLVLLESCAGSQPARFYTLSALTAPEAVKPADAGATGVAIGLRPIVLPKYLDRPQIMTRVGPNEFHYAEFDRWAEPLEDNFASVLGQNLSILLPAKHILRFPWRNTTPIDYQVTVDVARFEGRTTGHVVLDCRWDLFSGDGKTLLAMKKTVIQEPVPDESYAALVASESRTLQRLAEEIASAIQSIPR